MTAFCSHLLLFKLLYSFCYFIVEGWVYGVGIGSAGVIITIVIAVLRICFGCFACFDSATGAASIELGATNNAALKN